MEKKKKLRIAFYKMDPTIQKVITAAAKKLGHAIVNGDADIVIMMATKKYLEELKLVGKKGTGIFVVYKRGESPNPVLAAKFFWKSEIKGLQEAPVGERAAEEWFRNRIENLFST